MREENPLSAFESVKVVRLRAGDVLLFRCASRLSAEQHARAKEVLNRVFGDFETMILDGGQDVAVMRPEPGFIGRILRKVFARKSAAA